MNKAASAIVPRTTFSLCLVEMWGIPQHIVHLSPVFLSRSDVFCNTEDASSYWNEISYAQSSYIAIRRDIPVQLTTRLLSDRAQATSISHESRRFRVKCGPQ